MAAMEEEDESKLDIEELIVFLKDPTTVVRPGLCMNALIRAGLTVKVFEDWLLCGKMPRRNTRTICFIDIRLPSPRASPFLIHGKMSACTTRAKTFVSLHYSSLTWAARHCD